MLCGRMKIQERQSCLFHKFIMAKIYPLTLCHVTSTFTRIHGFDWRLICLVICLIVCRYDIRKDTVTPWKFIQLKLPWSVMLSIIEYFQHRIWMTLVSLSSWEIALLLRWIPRLVDMSSVFLSSLKLPSSSQIISRSAHPHPRHHAS
jgi:hypothetical protein